MTAVEHVRRTQRVLRFVVGGSVVFWAGAVLVGGLVLGLIESLSVAFISSTYKDAIALLVLLAVLFLKPSGLFGQASREKV